MDLPKVGANYLNNLLPRGWNRFFTARAAGKYWGLSIQCPTCEARPPSHVRYGSQRWRWLSVHQMSHRNLNGNGRHG